MMFSLFAFLAHAQPQIPKEYLPKPRVLSLEAQIFQHGPDGPPPDGGYTIKDDGGGNFLGKVGLLGLGGGIVSGVLFLTAEEGSAEKEQYGTIAIASTTVGVSCIFLKRVF